MRFRYYAAVCNTSEARAVHLAGHRNALASFAYPRHVRSLVTRCFAQPDLLGLGNLMVDSGAFTAHTQGRPVELAAYGEFCTQFQTEHRASLASLEFLNLDVIGDQRASGENHRRLAGEYGIDAVPVFTYGAGLDDLARLAADHPRLALGGLVPLHQNVRALNVWLTRCFDVLHGSGAEVHLLGIGRISLIRDFPVASCDSGAFSRSARFIRGEEYARRFPDLTGAALRIRCMAEELIRLQALERTVNLWRPAHAYRPSTQLDLFPATLEAL